MTYRKAPTGLTLVERTTILEQHVRVDDFECWNVKAAVGRKRVLAWELYGLGEQPRYIGVRCHNDHCISPHHMEGARLLCGKRLHPMTPSNYVPRTHSRMRCLECYSARTCKTCGRPKSGENLLVRKNGAEVCRFCEMTRKVVCTATPPHDLADEDALIVIRGSHRCAKCWRARNCDQGLHPMNGDNVLVQTWKTGKGNLAYREVCRACRAAQDRHVYSREEIVLRRRESSRAYAERNRVNKTESQRKIELAIRNRRDAARAARMSPEEHQALVEHRRDMNNVTKYVRRFMQFTAVAPRQEPVADWPLLAVTVSDERKRPEAAVDSEALVDLLKRAGVNLSEPLRLHITVVGYQMVPGPPVQVTAHAANDYTWLLRDEVMRQPEQVALAARSIAHVQEHGPQVWQDKMAARDKVLNSDLRTVFRAVRGEGAPSVLTVVT